MEIHVGNAKMGSCFFSQTDSTSPAAGWIQKSNFGDVHPMHLQVARAIATLMMDHDSTVYSQWFEGNSNEVADALSRDHQLSDAQLLNLFLSLIPEQIPNNFRSCPLPLDAVSRIMTWLHSLPPLMQSPKEPQRSKLTTGATGKPTSKPLSLMMTPSSPPSHEETNTNWSLVLPPPSEPMTSNPMPVHQQLLHQYLAQSAPPLMQLHRPIGLTTGSAQYTTTMGTLHSFYSEF
jgi:hypothetical protein